MESTSQLSNAVSHVPVRPLDQKLQPVVKKNTLEDVLSRERNILVNMIQSACFHRKLNFKPSQKIPTHHIELRNLRWRSGVSFLVILEHFLKTSDIFRSTCRMMTIERALDSPDPNACFKYPERIHIMFQKFSTAL